MSKAESGVDLFNQIAEFAGTVSLRSVVQAHLNPKGMLPTAPSFKQTIMKLMHERNFKGLYEMMRVVAEGSRMNAFYNLLEALPGDQCSGDPNDARREKSLMDGRASALTHLANKVSEMEGTEEQKREAFINVVQFAFAEGVRLGKVTHEPEIGAEQGARG